MLAALNLRLDQPLSADLRRQIVEMLVDGIVVETVGEGEEREPRVCVTYRFGAPGPSIDRDANRGIRVLQTLALPLGYAASARPGILTATAPPRHR